MHTFFLWYDLMIYKKYLLWGQIILSTVFNYLDEYLKLIGNSARMVVLLLHLFCMHMLF